MVKQQGSCLVWKVLVQEVLEDQIAMVPALHFLLLSFHGVVWVGRNRVWVGAIEMVPLVSGHLGFTRIFNSLCSSVIMYPTKCTMVCNNVPL